MSNIPVTESFNRSLWAVVDASALSDYDNWTILAVKSVNLVLALVALLELFAGYLSQGVFGVPQSMAIFLAVFGFIVVCVFDVSYRLAMASRNVYSRTKLVLFGTYGVLFGSGMGLLVVAFYAIPPHVLADVLFAIGFVALVLVSISLDRRVRVLIASMMSRILRPDYSQFSEFLSGLLTSRMVKYKLFSGSVAISVAVTVLWSYPSTWLLCVPFWLSTAANWYAFVRDKETQRVLVHSGPESSDPATFVRLMVSCLSNAGIRNYTVHYKPHSFDSRFDLVMSTSLAPLVKEPVRVVHLLGTVDLDAVRQFLGEDWPEGVSGRIANPIGCPLWAPVGRIVIDRRVLKATELLMVPTSILAVSFSPGELEVANHAVGDFMLTDLRGLT